jgi:DNA-binding PucR family transcriptional regulator
MSRFSADVAEFADSFSQQIVDRFQCAPLACGVGSIYTDWSNAELSYREALAVLELKAQFPEMTNAIIHYHSLGYYRYLPYFLQQKQLHRYENRSLKLLREYDREHHANLTETLESFLACDGNVKATADLLHVHANTLTYRLKRIAEIGEIDFANVDQKITLFLDMKTDRLSQSGSS